MAQVQQSPGLISTPTIESQGFVGAQPMRPDMSFTKYGQKALGNLRDASKVYSDYQEEQRKKAMEARVADAASEYYKRCMEQLVGKDGALLQKEYDVVKGYDGKSFTQYWGEKIDGIANDIISESADPELRQAFLKSIRGYRDSFYGQLFGHEGSEGRKYAESSFRVQGDVASDQVSRGQNLSGAFGTIVNSMTRIADLQGKNVKDKTVKEAIRRDAQAAYAKSLEIHVTDLLSQGDIDRAVAAAQTAVRAGAIDGNAYNALQTKLKEGYDLFQVKAITESTISRIRESHSPAGVLWSVAASEGFPDTALDQILGKDHPLFAQGSDSGTEVDREVLRARGIQAMDKLIVDCGGTTNASYYLAAGSEARAQELRQMWEKVNSELDAADQRPSGSFTWADAEKFMTPEEKAKQKRIAKGFDRGMAQTKKMGLQDFYREAKAANPTVSDDVLAASAAQVKSDYDKKRVLEDIRKQGTLDEIIRRFSSGTMDLTGLDMSQFSTEEKADIAEIRRVYSANITKENPELTADLMNNPSKLTALTKTQLALLRAHVSPEELNLLTDTYAYYEANGGVGDGKVGSSDVKLAVTRWAYSNPEYHIADDPKARARAEMLAYMVLADAAKKRASKDPITQEQAIKLIDDRLNAVYAKTTHTGGLIGFNIDSDSWGVTKSFASFGKGWLLDVITTNGLSLMNVDGNTLGAEGRKFLENVFQKNGDMRPEDYTGLFEKFVYDPRVTIPKNALPEPKDDPDIERLISEFFKINKKMPDYDLLCQMWLFKKAGFGTALDRYMGRKTELKPRVGSISYEDFYDNDASAYKDAIYGSGGVD